MLCISAVPTIQISEKNFEGPLCMIAGVSGFPRCWQYNYIPDYANILGPAKTL